MNTFDETLLHRTSGQSDHTENTATLLGSNVLTNKPKRWAPSDWLLVITGDYWHDWSDDAADEVWV